MYLHVVISIQRILVGRMDFWILMRPVALEWSTEGLRSLHLIWVWGSTEACTYLFEKYMPQRGGQQMQRPWEDSSLFCWRHSEKPPVTRGTGFKKGKQDLRPKQGVGKAEHLAPYKPWEHWLSPVSGNYWVHWAEEWCNVTTNWKVSLGLTYGK